MQQILNDIKSSSNSLPIVETLLDQSDIHSLKKSVVSTTSIISDSSFNQLEYFYDMQPKHFGDDKVRKISYEKNLTEYEFVL